MSQIIDISPLGFPWETQDPFLFCAHHDDKYPAGNSDLGPNASLDGRRLGEDFVIKDGWRMYHGNTIPGFPYHPHRGFETITIATKGFVDHADSLGAAGRFSNGDVQWMTAGKGVQHSEMFPLLNQDKENPLEIFQIWLNLPAKNKLVDPHYAMLWSEDIPVINASDQKVHIKVITGDYLTNAGPEPTPNSWAQEKENEVRVWLIEMKENCSWTIPSAKGDVNRSLFFYEGDELTVDGSVMNSYHVAKLKTGDISIHSKTGAKMLFLQGKPINEPVAKYGPFVMNTQQEIQQTFIEYQRTQFGGWPWPKSDMVHDASKGRFAIHADGKREKDA